MKLMLFAVMMLVLAACTSPAPYKPSPSAASSEPSDVNKSTFKSDVIDCERTAALAGTGGKGAAFDRCMRARGHIPGR
jgi:hypothetical protein